MPKLVQDESGAYFVDQGGGIYQRVNEQQAQTFLDAQQSGFAGTAGQAVGQGIENLITGAGALLSDNPYWLEANRQGRGQVEALSASNPIAALGEYAPQVGLGAGRLGVLPTMGLEAGLGALTTPEAPVTGALIGGGLGGLGAAAPGVIGKGYQMARPYLPGGKPSVAIPPIPGMPRGAVDLPSTSGAPDSPTAAGSAATTPSTMPTQADLPSPSANPPGAPPNAAPRMAERRLAAMEASDQLPAAGGPRAFQGLLTPETLERRFGVPLSEGDRALLNATGQDEVASALERLGKEAGQESHPIFGGDIRAVRHAQRQAATNYAKDLMEIDPRRQLVPATISERMTGIGKELDDIAEQMGNVGIGDELRSQFTEILENTTGAHKGQIERLIKEIEAKAALNGGAISGQDWGIVRSKLSKMMEYSAGQGKSDKAYDAGKLMEVMSDALETRLPVLDRRRLQDLRKQWAIGATLNKAGVVDHDGIVTPSRFYSNWERPQSFKYRGQDDVGEFMNTMATLTSKRIPDSGTAPRLLRNLVDMGLDFVPGGQAAKRIVGQ